MKLRTVIATATSAAVLSTSGIALAGATAGSSNSTPTSPASAASARLDARRHPVVRRHRARLHLRRLLRGAGGIITETIGIDRPTLRQDLRNGQTVAEIATAHGVAPQVVVDALVSAAKTRLDAAVAAGRITAERAARIEQRLPDRITRLVDSWHPKHLRTTP